jgi:soluble P-type ATPase
MIEIPIPGDETLRLHHLVADFNGTLAIDGVLLPGVADALREVATRLEVHVVTADTYGAAGQSLAALPVTLTVLAAGDEQAQAKRRYAERLGAARCAAVGNGRNDEMLVGAVALGIAVVQAEGAASRTIARRASSCPTSERRSACC